MPTPLQKPKCRNTNHTDSRFWNPPGPTQVNPSHQMCACPSAFAGTHMWTAPVPQEFFHGVIGFACIHMSGLLMRSGTAGQDGFRDASSKHTDDLCRPMGPTDCLAPRNRFDPTICLLCSSGTGRCGGPEGAPPDRSLLGGVRRCDRLAACVIALARHQQPPGDAGNLVGERHRRELRRLARQQRQ